MAKRWTAEEIDFIKSHPKYNIKKLSECLGRSENAVINKCAEYDCYMNKSKRYWSKTETEAFIQDWNDDNVSYRMLQKKYKNRSIKALRSKAKRLSLGRRSRDESYLTIKDIMTEMNVSKDRVRTWIRNGLKNWKSRIKPYKYLISQESLLEFLKNHPDMYNASEVSPYLFPNEPEWFKKKRRKDMAFYAEKAGGKYSKSELVQIEYLFKLGKSNEQIAEYLKRTPSGIEKQLNEMNLSRKRYNDYEIELIRKNAEIHTIDEITKMLPLRTKEGIISKCQQLKIKYHSNPAKNRKE